MGIICTAGRIIYMISPNRVLTPHEVTDACSARVAVHDVMRAAPIVEWLGKGQKERKDTIYFVREFGIDPDIQYSILQTMMDNGEHFPIIWAGRPIAQHDWYIDSIGRKIDMWEPITGQVTWCETTVTFRAYQ